MNLIYLTTCVVNWKYSISYLHCIDTANHNFFNQLKSYQRTCLFVVNALVLINIKILNQQIFYFEASITFPYDCIKSENVDEGGNLQAVGDKSWTKLGVPCWLQINIYMLYTAYQVHFNRFIILSFWCMPPRKWIWIEYVQLEADRILYLLIIIDVFKSSKVFQKLRRRFNFLYLGQPVFIAWVMVCTGWEIFGSHTFSQ